MNVELHLARGDMRALEPFSERVLERHSWIPRKWYSRVYRGRFGDRLTKGVMDRKIAKGILP